MANTYNALPLKVVEKVTLFSDSVPSVASVDAYCHVPSMAVQLHLRNTLRGRIYPGWLAGYLDGTCYCPNLVLPKFPAACEGS